MKLIRTINPGIDLYYHYFQQPRDKHNPDIFVGYLPAMPIGYSVFGSTRVYYSDASQLIARQTGIRYPTKYYI